MRLIKQSRKKAWGFFILYENYVARIVNTHTYESQARSRVCVYVYRLTCCDRHVNDVIDVDVAYTYYKESNHTYCVRLRKAYARLIILVEWFSPMHRPTAKINHLEIDFLTTHGATLLTLHCKTRKASSSCHMSNHPTIQCIYIYISDDNRLLSIKYEKKARQEKNMHTCNKNIPRTRILRI